MSSNNSAELRKTLNQLIKKVPYRIVHGTWNAAVSYKKWIVVVNKVLANRNATASELESLIHRYHSF